VYPRSQWDSRFLPSKRFAVRGARHNDSNPASFILQDANNMSSKEDPEQQSDITLEAVIDGTTERGIAIVKYVEDIGEFANSFTPTASAELLIGAYTDLFSKFKSLETRMTQKCESYDVLFVMLWVHCLSFAPVVPCLIPL
jgi:hypothetical protein